MNNTFWAMLGMVVFAISQWSLVVIISKVLGAEAIGVFSFGMAIVNPIFAFSSLQLKAHYATQKTDKYDFSDYVGIRISSGIASTILALVTSLFFRIEAYFIALVFGLCAMKYMDSLSDIFYGVNQRESKLRVTAISMILRGLFGSLIFIVFIKLRNELITPLFALVSAWIIVLFFYDIKMPRYFNVDIRPRFGTKTVEIFKETWTMAIAVLLSSLLLNLPRYFISSSLGNEQLGIFSAQAYFMTFFCMLSVALAQSSSTQLTKSLLMEGHEFIKLLCRNVLLLFIVALFILISNLIYGQELLTLIYSKQFADQKMFSMIIVGSFLWGAANVLDYGVIALRLLSIRPTIQVVAGLSMAITWFALVKNIGLLAAGYCLLVGGIVQFIFYSYLLINKTNSNQY